MKDEIHKGWIDPPGSGGIVQTTIVGRGLTMYPATRSEIEEIGRLNKTQSISINIGIALCSIAATLFLSYLPKENPETWEWVFTVGLAPILTVIGAICFWLAYTSEKDKNHIFKIIESEIIRK